MVLLRVLIPAPLGLLEGTLTDVGLWVVAVCIIEAAGELLCQGKPDRRLATTRDAHDDVYQRSSAGLLLPGKGLTCRRAAVHFALS
jgi:hypothetical protein